MIPTNLFKERKERVEDALQAILSRIIKQDTLINDMVTYTLFPTGKLLRPILTVLIYEMLGGTKGNIYACACATEIIHVATLVLDDLPCMDNSAYRRGKHSCHAIFGDGNATLIAFGLAAESFHILSDKNNFDGIKSNDMLRMMAEIAKKVGFNGLIGGQLADLRDGRISINLADDAQKINSITSNKTAALFEICALIACCLAETSEEETERMKTYAQNIGFALQLFDDLHDTTEDKGLSFTKVYGIQKTKELLHQKITASYDCITHTNEYALLLKQLPYSLLEISP